MIDRSTRCATTSDDWVRLESPDIKRRIDLYPGSGPSVKKPNSVCSSPPSRFLFYIALLKYYPSANIEYPRSWNMIRLITLITDFLRCSLVVHSWECFLLSFRRCISFIFYVHFNIPWNSLPVSFVKWLRECQFSDELMKVSYNTEYKFSVFRAFNFL